MAAGGAQTGPRLLVAMPALLGELQHREDGFKPQSLRETCKVLAGEGGLKPQEAPLVQFMYLLLWVLYQPRGWHREGERAAWRQLQVLWFHLAEQGGLLEVRQTLEAINKLTLGAVVVVVTMAVVGVRIMFFILILLAVREVAAQATSIQPSP